MIIFISGSINSGKSTVARSLARKLPNPALLEIDVLRKIIKQVPIDEAVPVNLENAVSIIKNLAKRNFNIVIPYPLSQKNYEYLRNNLKGINTKIFFFTLAPQLKKVLAKKGRRLSSKEKERVKYHYAIGMANPSFGKIIDNTNQKPQETARFILS